MVIGILTIHHVPNYGAVWQAYALSKYVASLGHRVEVIDYRPAVAVRHYSPKLRRTEVFKYLKQSYQYRGFQKFIKTQLPLGDRCCSDEKQLVAATAKYQMLIAGSDQIWCTGEGSFRGYDGNFFLEFCRNPEIRKISYAASAGNTTDFREHTQTVAESLRTFSFLAVRDEPTQGLVEKTTGRTPELVLDPTFLHDFPEVVEGVSPDNDLVIFANSPERFEKSALAIAQKHKLRIVSIGKPCRVAKLKREVVSPISWLRTLKGARVVLTDFFHGTALSLKFGRPLLVNAPQAKMAKISDLLRRADMMNHFLNDTDLALRVVDEALAAPEKYAARIQQNLEPHLLQSRQYLINALASQ